jgi:hypothetical protein
VPTLQQAYPEPEVERWATAPHRLGLTPLRRRAWSPRGQRPAAPVHHRSQWGALSAFVPPGTGRTWWRRRPTASMAAWVSALTALAHALGAGRGNQPRLGLGRAGWQVSPPVQAPAGIPRHVLPPYSPERQPAERLGPLTNEAVAPRHVRDGEARHTLQAHRGLALQARPERLAGQTAFHWWPQAGSTSMNSQDLV